MNLRLSYPRSFTVLLLVAFVLVTLPLLGGMLNTTLLLEGIAREGRISVATTVRITRASLQLVDGVSALQRATGQYYVLDDPTLLRSVADAHRQLLDSLATLREDLTEPDQRDRLEAFAAAESALFGQLRAMPGGGAESLATVVPRFDRLHGLALEIGADGQRMIGRQSAAMEQTAAAARNALFLQGSAMVSLSLLLLLFFSWLINRPVVQLAQAIRRLGVHDLTPGPAINGPRDLVFLGAQLEWLRLRLIELEEEKIRFLRHVSHELKTPLAALREGVELLADKVGGELTPQQEEITAIMRGNARDLQRRIEDLVRYSRAIRQAEPLRKEILGLDALLATVSRRHALAVRAKGLRLRWHVGDVHLSADREKMLTVLDNLLSNAIRFSPRGGEVEVAASATEGRTEIRVRDQGPGVPESERRKIFQPFYQGSVQPAGPVSGSGLGLAIVQEYVEAHGGQVALIDDPPWAVCFSIVFDTNNGGT